jgi:hypothetical protein
LVLDRLPVDVSKYELEELPHAIEVAPVHAAHAQLDISSREPSVSGAGLSGHLAAIRLSGSHNVLRLKPRPNQPVGRPPECCSTEELSLAGVPQIVRA